MTKIETLYRVDVDYYSKDYENAALNISEPFATYEDAITRYKFACNEFCMNDKTKHARVKLTKYRTNKNGKLIIKNHYLISDTIKQNY